MSHSLAGALTIKINVNLDEILDMFLHALRTRCLSAESSDLLLKERLKVGHEELLYGNASRTYNEGMLGVELLGEDAQATIGGAAAALDLYGYATAVVLDDEIYLVVSLAPVVETEVQFVGQVEEMCPHGALHPSAPCLGSGEGLRKGNT